MRIYAMGDIHGCLDAFAQRVAHLSALGFFEDGCADELVLLGDYIDRGPDSLGVVREAMRLERTCAERVFPLLGNHEDEFLRWLGEGDAGWDDDVLLDDGVGELLDLLEADFGPVTGYAAVDRMKMWRLSDIGGATMRSFLGADACARLKDAAAFERACERIRDEYAPEVRWMRGLREFHETGRQIFVHAGIEESRGAEWRAATPRDTMLWDRRMPRGPFCKDVVAGHTAASIVAGDPTLEGIFWDGASHFYVDGMTAATGRIPVLVYDCDSGTYHELDAAGNLRNIEPLHDEGLY